MFEPTALYQHAATGELAYGWQLNQYQAGLAGLGRNFLSTAWHKVKKGASNVAHAATHTTLGKIALGVGAAAAGAKLGQFTGLLPKGSLIDLAKLTPGILANQATRLGRGAASVAGTVGHAIFGGGSTPVSGRDVIRTPSILGTATKIAAPVAATLLTGGAADSGALPLGPNPPLGAIGRQETFAGPQYIFDTPAHEAAYREELARRRAAFNAPFPQPPVTSMPTPRVTLPNARRAPVATPTPRIQISPIERRGVALPPSPRLVSPPATTTPAASSTVPLLLAAGAAALALSS